MRKLFALFMLTMILVGCGSGAADTASYESRINELEKQLDDANNKIAELESDKGDVADKQETSETPASEPVDSSSNEINGLNVSINNLEALTINTYDGEKNVLRVDFTLTNNGSNVASFDTVLDIKAFQDAVQLDKVFDTETTGEYGDNSFKEIKTGGKVDISMLFETKSTSPIDLELSELLSFDDKVINLGTYNFK